MLVNGTLTNLPFIVCEMRSKRGFEVYRSENFDRTSPLQIVTDRLSTHHRLREASFTGIKHYERY